MKDKKILIVGGNGKTGSRVRDRLNATGVDTISVSRTTQPAFDWTQSSTWRSVLQDVDAAYLTYHPDLSVPQAEEHIQMFCNAAKQSGVQHIVLLSGRGEEGAKRAEDVLRKSGIAWNIVQASWFAQNYSEDFMLDSILAGELVIPTGAVSEPFLDIDDLADVVVATLLEPGLHNRLFEVTGPRCITFSECIEHIAAATQRPIQVTEVPMRDYVKRLQAQGLPSEFVDLLQHLFTDLFDGRNAYTADGVREALGRTPTEFREFAHKTAATGVWHAQETKEAS